MVGLVGRVKFVVKVGLSLGGACGEGQVCSCGRVISQGRVCSQGKTCGQCCGRTLFNIFILFFTHSTSGSAHTRRPLFRVKLQRKERRFISV